MARYAVNLIEVHGVGWHAPEPEAMGVVCTEDS
jgi:hypothetical protein